MKVSPDWSLSGVCRLDCLRFTQAIEVVFVDSKLHPSGGAMSSHRLVGALDQSMAFPGLNWGITGFLLALLFVALRNAKNKPRGRRQRQRIGAALRAAARAFFTSLLAGNEQPGRPLADPQRRKR
jgi:hypothetical protein